VKRGLRTWVFRSIILSLLYCAVSMLFLLLRLGVGHGPGLNIIDIIITLPSTIFFLSTSGFNFPIYISMLLNTILHVIIGALFGLMGYLLWNRGSEKVSGMLGRKPPH
jgi:hypothetical protein